MGLIFSRVATLVVVVAEEEEEESEVEVLPSWWVVV